MCMYSYGQTKMQLHKVRFGIGKPPAPRDWSSTCQFLLLNPSLLNFFSINPNILWMWSTCFNYFTWTEAAEASASLPITNPYEASSLKHICPFRSVAYCEYHAPQLQPVYILFWKCVQYFESISQHLPFQSVIHLQCQHNSEKCSLSSG
jgi:hypothetical protein